MEGENAVTKEGMVMGEILSTSDLVGPPIIIHVVNTTNEKKNGFELFKPCDNVCSKYFEENKLVIDGVEISGRPEVSYRQLLWHMLLYGMSIRATMFLFDKDIPEGADFTFRIKSVSVDACVAIVPMYTDRLDIMVQHQKNIILDKRGYNLGYSDSMLLDIPALSKVEIYLYQDRTENTRGFANNNKLKINKPH